MSPADREQILVRAYRDTGNLADALEITLSVVLAKRRAEEAVKQIAESSIGAIMAAVGKRYGLTVQQLREHTKIQAISEPRSVAIYLVRKHAKLSWESIARLFGWFNHVSMIYAFRRVESRPDLLEDAREIGSLIGLAEQGQQARGSG